MRERPTQPSAVRPGEERITPLDLIRGYFILIIASIHLHYYPSLFGLFDGRGMLWVSEAEGFFFISGLLIGIIRGRDMAKSGLWSVTRKSWGRAWKLYVAATVLTFLFTAIARATIALGIPGAKEGLAEDPSWLMLAYKALTLQFAYGWADFLIYYVAFLLLTPLAVWLLARGRGWVVLALSLGIWVLRWRFSFGPVDPFLQWQVFFFMGVIAGFNWRLLRQMFERLSSALQRRLAMGAMASALMIYAAGMIFLFGPGLLSSSEATKAMGAGLAAIAQMPLYDQLLIHNRVGLLRPMLLLFVFAGMFAFVARYEAQVVRYAGWLLLPFGRNSLYVYILESILLFAVPFLTGPRGFIINSFIEITIVGLILLAVRQRLLFGVIPR